MKQTYEYLVSLGTIALVLAGLTGLSFHAFRDSGWVELALERVWSFELEYPAIAIPLTVAAVLLVRAWRRRNAALGRVSRLPIVFIYCLMGAGAYFIGHYALRGGL